MFVEGPTSTLSDINLAIVVVIQEEVLISISAGCEVVSIGVS